MIAPDLADCFVLEPCSLWVLLANAKNPCKKICEGDFNANDQFESATRGLSGGNAVNCFLCPKRAKDQCILCQVAASASAARIPFGILDCPGAVQIIRPLQEV